MLVMGFSGGIDRITTNKIGIGHDSAAVLLVDGKVVAAHEEERLNRIKHTNKFPTQAIQACLRQAGAQLRDVDRFAVNFTEESGRNDLISALFGGAAISALLGLDPSVDTSPRALMNALLQQEIGASIDPSRFYFVKHHLTHAYSAFLPSGFERALVVTMDGQGEDESGYVATADERGIEILRTTPVHDSIGLFYTYLTLFLGFKHHDEYKVMGLAPYGDPAVFRSAFKEMYSLAADGAYAIHREQLAAFATKVKPRQPAQSFDQHYRNIAASLQEAVEDIVFHVLRHYRSATGLENLCIAGGVGHNCTLNGKILGSGLFAKMFVQPASHDAGCALGAALAASRADAPRESSKSNAPMPHLFTGTDIGDASSIEATLARWEPILSVRRSDRVAEDAARLLAEGSVIGWVQGRSEFGPRALGNRSILADPRPAENKEIINAMVKKREGFRPFAPAVLIEQAKDFFEIPAAEADLAHMTYVLQVRPDKRALLGAITHVDGSARVQTVERAYNERYWGVIRAFGELTGVPVVLNTSFNNNAEPIVDTVDDAVVCFLTTKLNMLVVGDFIVSKRELTYDRCRSLVPAPCRHVSLERIKALGDSGKVGEHLVLGNTNNGKKVPVSLDAYRVLDAADGARSIDSIAHGLGIHGESVLNELLELWSSRLITLSPRGRSAS